MSAVEEILTNEFKQKNADGGWVRDYGFGRCGPKSVALGMADALASGGEAVFVVADHHTHGDAVHAVIRVSVGTGELRHWRYNGVDDGSYAITTGDPEDLAVAAAVVSCELGICLGRNPHSVIYRQPETT